MPANNNNQKRIDTKFASLVKPFSKELSREGSFVELIANLENLHYEYEVTHFGDHFGHASLICNDHYKIHIGPQRDKKRRELPMTTWHEYPEFARDFFAERNQGIAGYYSFQADFELVYDDWDPETDEETTSMGEKGESQIGSIECAAHDFQEFIEDAVRKLSIKFDIDLYPKRIPLKREIA